LFVRLQLIDWCLAQKVTENLVRQQLNKIIEYLQNR
jgi:hypothetical protein